MSDSDIHKTFKYREEKRMAKEAFLNELDVLYSTKHHPSPKFILVNANHRHIEKLAMLSIKQEPIQY